jgi:hypothetical protein
MQNNNGPNSTVKLAEPSADESTMHTANRGPGFYRYVERSSRRNYYLGHPRGIAAN